jgi:hypothetical protein
LQLKFLHQTLHHFDLAILFNGEGGNIHGDTESVLSSIVSEE